MKPKEAVNNKQSIAVYDLITRKLEFDKINTTHCLFFRRLPQLIRLIIWVNLQYMYPRLKAFQNGLSSAYWDAGVCQILYDK